jgi:hypothetical protein
MSLGLTVGIIQLEDIKSDEQKGHRLKKKHPAPRRAVDRPALTRGEAQRQAHLNNGGT